MQLGYPFPQFTPLKGYPHLCKQLFSSYPSAGGYSFLLQPCNGTGVAQETVPPMTRSRIPRTCNTCVVTSLPGGGGCGSPTACGSVSTAHTGTGDARDGGIPSCGSPLP